jgi:hypothetical protein
MPASLPPSGRADARGHQNDVGQEDLLLLVMARGAGNGQESTMWRSKSFFADRLSWCARE